MKLASGANLHVSPSPIVNASRIFRETLAVADEGLFRNVIICGTKSEDLSEGERLSDGRRIERVGRISRGRKRSAIGRAFDQIRWSIAVYQKYARQKISMVNAHSVAVLPVCYALARKHDIRLIYDTHELETETGTSLGLQRWVFKFIERVLISRCDAVFVVNESIADWYRARYPSVDPLVVRNIPGTQRTKRTVAMRGLLSVPDRKKLYIHVGNIGNSRGIDVMLETFMSKDVDDHIVFLGAGNLAPLVREASAYYPNIHWMAPVPPEEVLKVIENCDVGLCLISTDALSYRLSLPNKAMEYIAASTPFFFSNLVEVRRTLGSGFDSWQLDQPHEQLLPAVLSLTDEEITTARSRLKGVDLPTWKQEAIAMLVAYRSLLA